MDYNTSRKKLVLPEYGRNIQKMVEHMLTIQDRTERNEAAKAIITILGNLNPHLRDISDFKHKLWDHLALMSDFKVDIDYPYTPPDKLILFEKPRKVNYITGKIAYRYYGRIIEKLVLKAAELEEGERKETLIELVTNHMKKAYLMWNKESVSDEQIFEDLKVLSKGQLIVNENLKLSNSRDIITRTKKKVNGIKRIIK